MTLSGLDSNHWSLGDAITLELLGCISIDALCLLAQSWSDPDLSILISNAVVVFMPLLYLTVDIPEEPSIPCCAQCKRASEQWKPRSGGFGRGQWTLQRWADIPDVSVGNTNNRRNVNHRVMMQPGLIPLQTLQSAVWISPARREECHCFETNCGCPSRRYGFFRTHFHQHCHFLLKDELSSAGPDLPVPCILGRQRQFSRPTAVRSNSNGPSDCSLLYNIPGTPSCPDSSAQPALKRVCK
ncbi:hypothetical protein BJX70DRAFT_251989 [Aspergillus crustosus]